MEIFFKPTSHTSDVFFSFLILSVSLGIRQIIVIRNLSEFGEKSMQHNKLISQQIDSRLTSIFIYFVKMLTNYKRYKSVLIFCFSDDKKNSTATLSCTNPSWSIQTHFMIHFLFSSSDKLALKFMKSVGAIGFK